MTEARSPTDHVDDLVGAYALDALEPEERRTVEGHLSNCQKCTEAEGRARQVAMLLPMTVSTAGPPPELRQRLFERLAAERSSAQVRPPATVVPLRPAPGEAESRRRELSWNVVPALLAAAALIALGVWNVQLQRELGAQREHVALLSRAEVRVLEGSNAWEYEEGREYQGRAYIDRASDRVMLALSRLPPLPEDRVYQLWFTRPDGRRDSGGTFRVGMGEAGTFVAEAPAGLGAYEEIGITVEPEGGSAAPTSPRIVGANL